MDVSVDSLYNMVQAERKTGEVIQLPKDFYRIAEIKLQAIEKSQDMQHVNNFKKLLASIKERRIQKLLIYLAYNKLLPIQVPEEEEELYRKVKLLLENKQDAMARIRRVRITTEMPELMMPNGSKSGPYKQNQVLELTGDYEIEFLLNNKLGEQI